ncbi:alpha/beta hydrolase [Subtercola lobariae]|uniref:Alpha/beta hydrolase fold-3 domain-containing protein n=1 Tax=Subtercola lobariae TaxID=1588641 RepID=A0A917B907_9MICO|nr:alpha/beta hydrolase [Subtercola lobariae]GGF28615.1 hypothetical protein GCM10011399_22230 [Subtercola lobariae]
MTAIPARVRAWGWFMNRFRSMHIATMSAADITHNQSMTHLAAPVRRAIFGRRDRRVRVDDRTIPPAPGSSTGIPIRIYWPVTPPAASAASGPPAPSAPPGPPAVSAASGPSEPSEPSEPDRTTPPPFPTPTPLPLPIALYFHGGGWTLFGGLDVCDWLPSRVAAELGAIVVAVDYRLAPQHPFPAAIDDSYAALQWVAANAAHLGGNPARIAVFGDSAGGNIAAVLSVLARDAALAAPASPAATTVAAPAAPSESKAAATPAIPAATADPATPTIPHIASQALIYPVTDTVLDDTSMLANARSPVLHRADMAAFFDYYLGPDTASPTRMDARASPARTQSLANLPPTLVQLGAHDVLHDQGRAFARRLEAEGTEVELITYPEAPHGWVTYPTIMRVSNRATDGLVEFLRQHLA